MSNKDVCLCLEDLVSAIESDAGSSVDRFRAKLLQLPPDQIRILRNDISIAIEKLADFATLIDRLG